MWRRARLAILVEFVVSVILEPLDLHFIVPALPAS